jgi:nucleoside phosphorylase
VVEVWSPERLKEHARANSLRLALVVTALDLELKAAMAHLAPLTTVKGRRIYESGTFEEGGSRWLCVVVESGMGTHGAQSAVTDALVDFTFEAMVFAGVGGSRKDDVPIGSVVAADHVYMPYGGKIEGTGVVGRPREYPADADLLDSARKVRRDGSWHDRIKPPEGGVAGWPCRLSHRLAASRPHRADRLDRERRSRAHGRDRRHHQRAVRRRQRD